MSIPSAVLAVMDPPGKFTCPPPAPVFSRVSPPTLIFRPPETVRLLFRVEAPLMLRVPSTSRLPFTSVAPFTWNGPVTVVSPSRPRKVKKPHVYLSHDQVHELAGASKYPTLVLVLAYCGLRWGEATGLRVKHLDMLRRRFLIEENAVQVGSVIEVGTPRTIRSGRCPFRGSWGSSWPGSARARGART